MTTRHEQLAKTLRTQHTLTVSALAVLFAIALGSIAWALAAPAMAEREASTAVKEDFRETWCATYGVDPTDPGLEMWKEFADRNRAYMGENWQDYSYVDTNLDGSRTFELYVDLAVKEYPLWGYTPKDFWFNSALSNFFYVFEFEGGYGSPPSC
jgi:hypothetical protein